MGGKPARNVDAATSEANGPLYALELLPTCGFSCLGRGGTAFGEKQAIALCKRSNSGW